MTNSDNIQIHFELIWDEEKFHKIVLKMNFYDSFFFFQNTIWIIFIKCNVHISMLVSLTDNEFANIF